MNRQSTLKDGRVSLTWYERCYASTVAMMRYSTSLMRKSENRPGIDPCNGLAYHRHGAPAEMAFAKWRGVYWGGEVNTFKSPDVDGFQVRGASGHRYGLIVRPHDSDDEPYVLVTGKGSAFIVQGWAYGREVKQYGKWTTFGKGRAGAWLLSQGPHLRSIDTLDSAKRPDCRPARRKPAVG